MSDDDDDDDNDNNNKKMMTIMPDKNFDKYYRPQLHSAIGLWRERKNRWNKCAQHFTSFIATIAIVIYANFFFSASSTINTTKMKKRKENQMAKEKITHSFIIGGKYAYNSKRKSGSPGKWWKLLKMHYGAVRAGYDLYERLCKALYLWMIELLVHQKQQQQQPSNQFRYIKRYLPSFEWLFAPFHNTTKKFH